MTESNGMLDFASDDTLAGFRLRRLELYNWGTFHNRIWVLPLDGRNALLTGEIGSGKSTIVDAINTLLVPPARVAFNRAAGADRRERDLRSYVLGYHRSERTSEGSSARPVALREKGSYSVILAVFANEGFHQTVTLAQVLWQKDGHGQPDRFYVVADSDLSIKESFTNFGSDIGALRKRLRALPQTEPIFDSYTKYGAAFRRRFGLKSDQALMLFHQTVSMKSVGNLTDFVREHMLEPFDVAPRIEALLAHFDDLRRAHEAILRARDQIARLGELEAQLSEYEETVEREAHWRSCRDGLRAYFAHSRANLLEARLVRLVAEWEKLIQRRRELDAEAREESADRDRIKQAISESGGDRLQRLRSELSDLEIEKARRVERYGEYRSIAADFELPDPENSDRFVDNRGRIAELIDERTRSIDEAQNAMTEHGVELRRLRQDHKTVSSELESLRSRRTNIDSAQIAIRARMCRETGIDELELPFAGELLRVKEGEKSWQGAIERVLRNFGLSLLVPSEHYEAVSDYVDRANLRGRLVYFRIRVEHERGYEVLPDDDALATKVEVKPDTPLGAWLREQLTRRFDFTCCEAMDHFRRAKKALTRAGQIKGAGARHEKDDRYALDDRSRYVLGWDNIDKIRVIEARLRGIEEAIADAAERYSRCQATVKAAQGEQQRLYRLKAISDFSEINWRPTASRIESVAQEIAAVEASSDLLKTLGAQLSELEQRIEKTRAARDRTGADLATNEERRRTDIRRLEEDRAVVDATAHDPAQLAAAIEPHWEEALGQATLSIENAGAREQDFREWLQARIDAEAKRRQRLEQSIVLKMQDLRRDYPTETQEMDTTVEAGWDYLEWLRRLRADDLPRFEERFKTLLNENTIREIANFQAQLHKESQIIGERVDAINRSLNSIEYEPGRYIRLEALPAPDQEIRSFQQELRDCTEGTIGGEADDRYSEGKFNQVKSILDRFRGREGTAELDRRWTEKVTDVRAWFVFAASVRWREDDTEYEHYTDSSGKSGGQKEKLAYTVLAASVAYQFGLEWGEKRSRSFRFVVIDEAFGRGSDESARFGLELFRQLNLQLLIVTPLQKIHIIEPYVSTVGFVHNADGRASLLRCLTIEEFRHERERYTRSGPATEVAG